MEGFVNTDINSPFDYGLKHSGNYANYGVDRAYIKREPLQTEQKSDNKANKSQSLNTKQNPAASNIALTLPSNIDKTVVDTVTLPDKNSRQKMYATAAVGGSIIVLGGAALAITKGRIPRAIADGMGKLIDNITKKTEEIKQKPSISNLEGLYLSGLQKVKKGAYMARGAIFNFSPLKDVLFDKFVRQKCGLQKPCDVVTNCFRKLSFGTVKSSYKNAETNINKMTNTFADVNKRIVSGEFSGVKPVSGKSVLQTVEQKCADIHSAFNRSFTERHLNERNTNLIQTLDGLGNRVYDRIYGNMRGFFKDVKEWTSFVPEVLIERDKAGFMKVIENKKKVITNSPQDNFNKLSRIIEKLNGTINPNHQPSRVLVKNLKELSKSYVRLSGGQEQAQRVKINELINKALTEAGSITESEVYTPEQTNKLMSLINQYGEVIYTDKKGAIEEILTVYKSILPPEEYSKVKKIAQKAIKSLNKAVYNEGFEYVDKVRDLATGSALTDVALGMAVPAVTTGVALSVADSKEKKRSVVLKYGLPLFIGIGTSTLCTLKLISGGKSLIFGTVAGTLANHLCEKLDDKLNKCNG